MIYSFDISIHALREEGDSALGRHCPQANPISIHALREEGDSKCSQSRRDGTKFLSTPSARRATESTGLIESSSGISIHALREEGDPSPSRWPKLRTISIHALREEGDAFR